MCTQQNSISLAGNQHRDSNLTVCLMYVHRGVTKIPDSSFILSKSQKHFIRVKREINSCPVCIPGKGLITSSYFFLYTVCCNCFLYFQLFIFQSFIYFKLFQHFGIFAAFLTQSSSMTVEIAHTACSFINTYKCFLGGNNYFVQPVFPLPLQIL